MDNEETVFDDTQSIVGDEVSSEEPTFLDIEEVDSEPDAEKAELERKNKELYARLKKTEEENKRLKSQPQDKPTNNSTQYATKEELERFALSQKYDEEIVGEIMRLGGSTALDNPLVKQGIDAMQAKKKSVSATPDTSGRSPIYKKFTEAELKAMPLTEMEKLLNK
jgi:hypothetical protein